MRLHVERSGQGRDLVLLHGWAMHSGVWAEVMPALESRYRVHAVDLPGHGHSPAADGLRFDEVVEKVADVVPEGAFLCGWSLGALVALSLAGRARPGIARLVLVSSTPCFIERDDWRHATKPATLDSFAAGLEADPERMLARFVYLNALHGARGRESARAFIARLGERGKPSRESLAASLEWLRSADLRADAARIAVPTLVVHGARDILAPLQAGRWLARSIAGARLLEIADAAHLPFFSHRDAFVAAVASHLG